MYVTSDIHHVLQGLTKLTTYIVHVSATLDDGGETDISEIEFETGKNIGKNLLKIYEYDPIIYYFQHLSHLRFECIELV